MPTKIIVPGPSVVIPVILVDIIKNCARCGGSHTNILFKSFAKPVDKYTHFGICPTTMEPILMVSMPDKKAKKARG